MGSYFGTDGIRGTVGGDLLTRDFARLFGHALADFLLRHNPQKPITIVVGRDTRDSGIDLQEAVSEGFCERDIHVIYLGVVPTPGIAMAVMHLHADLGIAITASHNPATDNGFKLFNNRGQKFHVEAEAEIEQLIDKERVMDPQTFTCGYAHDGLDHYVNYARSLLHQHCLKGWKVVMDCANGATAKSSPPVFRHFGAELVLLGDQPDGANINAGVGSEYPKKLAQAVLAEGAQLGIAHDGDGDRLVLCDEKGQIVEGDQLLGLLALQANRFENLANNTLVTTIQSNLGLDKTLEAHGITTLRTNVGDRNVLHAMIQGEYSLGGEQSGHIIFGDILMAGDGLIAAIKTVEAMLSRNLTLHELKQEIDLFPQRMRNVRIREKRPLADCQSLNRVSREIEDELNGSGRLLIRYSGTEPKLRLLVEARDGECLDPTLERLTAAASEDLELDG